MNATLASPNTEIGVASTATDCRGAKEVLRIEGVSKTFATRHGSVQALSPIDLTLNEGEIVALLGPSGCGKTTLLNMIAGFEKPTTGRILMDGAPVTGPGPQRMVMFQEHTLFPWLTVIDNAMFGLRNMPLMSQRERLDRARYYLNLVGISAFEKAYIHELSGGMKQRVALARALATHPRLLLMDEPFAALDAMMREELYGKIQEVLARTGQSVLMVTHNVREAACLADRVLVLAPRPGRVVYSMSVALPRPRDLYDPPVARHAASLLSGLRQLHLLPESDSEHATPPRDLPLLSDADRHLADGI